MKLTIEELATSIESKLDSEDATVFVARDVIYEACGFRDDRQHGNRNLEALKSRLKKSKCYMYPDPTSGNITISKP